VGHQNRTVEAVLAEIATAAKGVVTRAELLRAGVTQKQIRHRLRIGALHVEFPGVYRVGHRAQNVESRYLAAVRACGEGTILAARAAAYVYRLMKGSAPRPEVITLTERRVPGIITHRSRVPLGPDATTYHGIPITTVARTLIDLAAVLGEDELAWACHQAGVRHDTTPNHVEQVLRRRRTSPGAGKLRRVTSGEVKVTLSKLERRFLGRLREAGLPLPITNRPAGGRRVDCRWPEHKLTVELDGYRYHRSRYAWEQDRRREREARARGDDFRRYTWDDVFVHPRLMMRELIAYFAGKHPA
jgi:hypothetical protein